jgi:hypothetical protein
MNIESSSHYKEFVSSYYRVYYKAVIKFVAVDLDGEFVSEGSR